MFPLFSRICNFFLLVFRNKAEDPDPEIVTQPRRHTSLYYGEDLEYPEYASQARMDARFIFDTYWNHHMYYPQDTDFTTPREKVFQRLGSRKQYCEAILDLENNVKDRQVLCCWCYFFASKLPDYHQHQHQPQNQNQNQKEPFSSPSKSSIMETTTRRHKLNEFDKIILKLDQCNNGYEEVSTTLKVADFQGTMHSGRNVVIAIINFINSPSLINFYDIACAILNRNYCPQARPICDEPDVSDEVGSSGNGNNNDDDDIDNEIDNDHENENGNQQLTEDKRPPKSQESGYFQINCREIGESG
ncbi:unnamed protein product [Ambrosiozyma monospora]|uniref:Unnamed protein product n=1 Tax=Ambrosiozyma monospora TaxID=43982 RepID=A0ACB5SVN2_AMBMO|nr:unnamed protein product [Ambrosiozyma monospora]